MFGSDPAHSGNITPYDSAQMPKQNWTTQITNSTINSSPVVANGILYISATDKTLYALDASNGDILWNYTFLGNGIASSPAVSEGVVYVGAALGLFAFDAKTGTELWVKPAYAYSSSPAVVDGVVYFGSTDTHVYALNASTGTELWNYTTGSRNGVSPVVADGIVYVSVGRANQFTKGIYALNASTGEKIWDYTFYNGNWDSVPAVADGVVCFGFFSYGFYALSAIDGSLLWHSDIKYGSSPAVANGIVYFSTNPEKEWPAFYALDAITGKQIWFYATRVNYGPSPAVADGVVYFGSNYKNICAFNATSGSIIWKYTTSDDVKFSPVVGSREIFFASHNGKVHALVFRSESDNPDLESDDFDFFVFALPLIAVVLVAAILALTFYFKKIVQNNKNSIVVIRNV